MPKDTKEKLSYEALESLCNQIEEQVENGLKQQQLLIKTKNELDDKVRRFELIQKYGQEALEQTDIEEFGILTLEYFIEVFNQAKGVFIKIDESIDQIYVIATFGFSSEVAFDDSVIRANMSSFKDGCLLLSEAKYLQDALKGFQLLEGYVCPIISEKDEIAGLVILGQTQSDQDYFPNFKKADFSALATMCQYVGSLLRNLTTQEALKHEIDERTAITAALSLSEKKLKKAKSQLEDKVVERTQELELSNKNLKAEAIERHAIQLRLEEQAIELKRSNEDLKQFASAVSHDLKSPLRNIVTFADLIKIKYKDILDDTGRDYLRIMSGGVDNMVSIVDGLLHLANVSKPNVQNEYLDLNELADHVVKSMNHVIVESKAVVEIEKLPGLYANRFQIERLIQNLIENAIKFSGPKDPIVRLKAERKGNYNIFSVSDNGIGIDQQFKDKIFIIFQRLHTDQSYKGTGIGLAICKKVVERHHGEIWFESEIDKGTTFYFSIPA